MTAAAAIIHCATSTRGDVEATRNLVAVASRTGSAHLVYVSIVGIDHIASRGYPKTKLQAEQIVATSGLPWTILRVTQFYDYCLTNAKKLSWFPVAPVPAGFTVQPVDPRDVAARLVELALGEPASRAPDMAGPQVSSWTDLLRGYLKASHRRRWVLPAQDTGHPSSPQRRAAARSGTYRRLPDLGPVPHHPTAAASHPHRLARPAGRARTADRASQVNGCGVCVGAAAKAREGGESDERLFTLVAWRDTPFFTDAERAALALTEAVIRLSDRADPVPDEIGERGGPPL